MPTDAAQASRDLRAAIRRYLRERPDAADTLVGIAQWWLPELMQGTSMEQLRQVLTELVAIDEVRCTRLPDGTELYSRAEGASSRVPDGIQPG